MTEQSLNRGIDLLGEINALQDLAVYFRMGGNVRLQFVTHGSGIVLKDKEVIDELHSDICILLNRKREEFANL